MTKMDPVDDNSKMQNQYEIYLSGPQYTAEVGRFQGHATRPNGPHTYRSAVVNICLGRANERVAFCDCEKRGWSRQVAFGVRL